MIKTATAVISSAIIAKPYPSIYAILIPDFQSMYIGQTTSPYGALSRLSQHFSDTIYNTCLQRLCELRQLESVLPGNIHFCSSVLLKQNYHKNQKDLLEALEYLVQDYILTYLCDNNIPLVVISRVRPNSQCNVIDVKSDAEYIANEFITHLLTHDF